MVDAILSIPLMLEEQNDMVMLNEEAHGRYTTRSGYQYAMQELMNEERHYVQGTGIVYGKLVCLLKSVIGCGGFVEKVFTDERDYRSVMFHVRAIASYVMGW